MALAVNEKCTGSGEGAVVVRKETSLELSGPRVVAPGDEFRVAFQGFNHCLPQGNAHWEIQVEGAEVQGEAQGDFSLEKGGNQSTFLTLKASDSAETCLIRVKMTMGECQVTESIRVVIRAPYPAVDMLNVLEIPAGTEKEIQLGEYDSVDVGTISLALTGSLNWLGQYPYGCLEQVTAAAFPYLAVQPLVDAGILPAIYAKDATKKIQLAQMELSTHRYYNGMMCMWANGDVWPEGTYFAYLFYLEAEKQGFLVEQKFRKQMEDNLLDVQNNTKPGTISQRVFTSFILSYLNHAKALACIKLIGDNQCDGFEKFLRAVTKIRCGYSAEGMTELEKILQTDFLEKHDTLAGFDSEIRRVGMALWLLADIAPENPAVKKLADTLVARRNAEGHWGCTQDNAWAALGLAKFCAKNGSQGAFACQIVQDGKTENYTQACHFAGKRTLLIRNTSAGPIQAFVRQRVVARPSQNVSSGVIIHREYQDLSGKPVTQAKRGDLLRVVLKVSFKSDEVGNFVLSDLLPGGLEIEDDSLATRAKVVDSYDRKKLNFPVELLEKRFDRFLLFGTADWRNSPEDYTYSYLVRATTEGTFAIGPVSIESMYRVDLKALELPSAESFTVLPN